MKGLEIGELVETSVQQLRVASAAVARLVGTAVVAHVFGLGSGRHKPTDNVVDDRRLVEEINNENVTIASRFTESDELLDEFKQRQEGVKMQGMCDKVMHNAACDEVKFED